MLFTKREVRIRKNWALKSRIQPKAATIVIMASKASLIISTFFSCADGAKNNVYPMLNVRKQGYQCKPPLFRDGIRCKISYGLFVDSLQSGRNFGERVLGIFSATIMAIIFDFNSSDRLRREK